MEKRWAIEFSSPCVADLVECLNDGPIEQLAEEGDGKHEVRFIQKGLFTRFNGFNIYIYADEHPPPHFHVTYNGENNSFAITDASPLHPNGQLSRYFKNIKKWHVKNKAGLIDAWNGSRPSDCPVGKITC